MSLPKTIESLKWRKLLQRKPQSNFVLGKTARIIKTNQYYYDSVLDQRHYYANRRHTDYLIHCVKSVRIRSSSGPYFLAFELSLRNQSECRKMRTRKTPNMDTFHAVITFKNTSRSQNGSFRIKQKVCMNTSDSLEKNGLA